MEIGERIDKSLYNPSTELLSRTMQVSKNLHARADILKELVQMKKDLSHGMQCLEVHQDREPLDQLYTDLDNLIENERKKLLQETKSSKG